MISFICKKYRMVLKFSKHYRNSFYKYQFLYILISYFQFSALVFVLKSKKFFIKTISHTFSL